MLRNHDSVHGDQIASQKNVLSTRVDQ